MLTKTSEIEMFSANMQPGWNFLRLVWLWLIYVSATKDIYLREEESFTLSCTTAKNDFVTWHIHNSEKQMIAFGSLVSPVYTETFAVNHIPGRGVYNLTLFSFNSTAKYTSNGISCRTLTRENFFRLSLLEPPSDVVTIASQSSSGLVNRSPYENSTYFSLTGEEYQSDYILCKIEGGSPVPSIQWFNGPIKLDSRSDSGQSRSWASRTRWYARKLSFTYSKNTDRTNFTCEVSHPTFDQPRIFTVEIRLKYIKPSPPIISQIQSEDRDRVAYQCISFRGRPAPKVQWKLDDKYLYRYLYRSKEETLPSSSDTYTTKSTVSLKKSNTTRKLSCAVDRVSADVYVEVSPYIDIAFNVFPRNDEIFRGYNITLGCSAKKKRNIEWHRVEIAVGRSPRYMTENITRFYALSDEMVTFIDSRSKRASASVIRSPDEMKTYVTVYNVPADDKSCYKCTFFYLAPNFTIQSVEQTLVLSVGDSISDPPTVTIDDTEIIEGHELSARCSSQLREPVGYLDWQLTRTDGTVIHIPVFTDTGRASRRYGGGYGLYGSSSIYYTVDALDNGSLLTCVLLQERQPPISSSPVKITTVIAPPTGVPDQRLCNGNMQYKNFTTCEIDQWCYRDKKAIDPQTSYSIGCADIEDCSNVSGYMNGFCQACCMNNDYCSSYLC